MPLARMLASSAASSAAAGGVFRTLAGDRASWLRGIFRTLLWAVMAGDSCDGRARAVSRPGKPVKNPLSALFLLGAGGGSCLAGRRGGPAEQSRRERCGGFQRRIAVAKGQQIIGGFRRGACGADDG